MTHFVHPQMQDFSLSNILHALSDPNRLQIIKNLAEEKGLSCSNAIGDIPVSKSSLSMHFRVLREAGLIYTSKHGVTHKNILRRNEVDKRFPGLLKTLFKFTNP